MSVKAYRYTLYSQLNLGAFLLVCLILQPHYLFERNEGGISNFGVHMLTIVPYSLAFWPAGIWLYMAASALRGNSGHLVAARRILKLLGVLYILVVLTTYPYKLNSTFRHLHIYTSIGLFVAELLVAVWLVVALPRNTANLTLSALFFAGFVLAVLTLFGLLHVLFIAQILTAAAFGALLVRAIRVVVGSLP